MFYTSQRTMYNMELQLAQMFGKEYKFKNNTTLNQYLDILPDDDYPANTYPTVKYLTIGVGGDPAIEDPTVYPYSQHSPMDAGLFKMIPFVLREEHNDLDFFSRQKYRLRKMVTINGVNYYAYYLKVLDPNSEIVLKDDFYQISRRSGSSTLDVYPLETKDPLNPKPVTKVDKILSPNSSCVTKLCSVIFELKYAELVELREVFRILQIDTPTITEVGLCTGVDVIQQDNTIESVGAQIGFNFGINLDLQMSFNNVTSADPDVDQSTYVVFELGGTEPLYEQ